MRRWSQLVRRWLSVVCPRWQRQRIDIVRRPLILSPRNRLCILPARTIKGPPAPVSGPPAHKYDAYCNETSWGHFHWSSADEHRHVPQPTEAAKDTPDDVYMLVVTEAIRFFKSALLRFVRVVHVHTTAILVRTHH